MREQAHARHRCGRTFAQGRGLQTCARVQVRQAGWPEDQRKGQAYVGIPSRTDKKHAPNLDFAFGGDDFDFADVAWLRHLGGRDRGWPWRTVAALRTFPCPCRSALPACLSTGPTEKPPVGTLLLRALQLSVACCFKKR